MSAVAATISVKSPQAFRTISEVAAQLGVPQHVLRFWETRFVQVRPVKRAGGRRYYRPEEVDLLRGIRSLLYSDGYTIKGAQKVLREQGIRHVMNIGKCQPPTRRLARDEKSDEPRYAGAANAHVRSADAEIDTLMERPRELYALGRERLERLLKQLLQIQQHFRSARAGLAA